MEKLNALLSIDLNYIIIIMMVIFYSLEQFFWYLFQSPIIKSKRITSAELDKAETSPKFFIVKFIMEK